MKPQTQYKHYIPRFILRTFQDSATPTEPHASRGSSKKKRATQNQLHSQTETIHCYDLSTGEYNPSSLVSRSYGFANLYQDTTSGENVHHIEDKFSKLESRAATVIGSIQTSVSQDKSNIVLLRRELYTLRKFLFLLHLRGKAIGHTYFQEDHPGNAPARDWIRRQKELHNLTSDEGLWLHGIQYYLDTPTDRILNDARSSDSRQHSELFSMFSGSSHTMNPDIDIKHWHADAYEYFHNWYYVTICKTSPDSEFVLGHNSFGLWEGRLGGLDGQVHRLYIINPRIAIILRLNATRDPGFNMMMVDSILNDISFTPPVPRYTASILPTHDFPRPCVQNYSPDDTFIFKLHQLTEEQTYKVNEIVLENISADGTLTFASEDKMLSTLVRYDNPHGSFAKPHRKALRKLQDALSQRISLRGRSTSTSSTSGATKISSIYPTTSAGPSNQKEEAPMGTEDEGAGIAAAASDDESIPELVPCPEADPTNTASTNQPTDPPPRALTPPFFHWRPYVPHSDRERGHVGSEEELLPKTRDDDVFDQAFKDALASWSRLNGRLDLSLIQRVYLALNQSNKTNHPVALKIRYMVSETIQKRIMTKNGIAFPWVTPSRKLEEILTENEFRIVFAIGTNMAMEDGLYESCERPLSSSVLFIQQVAAYTYLNDWLYQQELLRLCGDAMKNVPDVFRRHKRPDELIQLSRHFFFGMGTMIQRAYCAWKFNAFNDRDIGSVLLISFTDPHDWAEKPALLVIALVIQFFGFIYVEELVSKVLWGVLYTVLGIVSISFVGILIASRRGPTA